MSQTLRLQKKRRKRLRLLLQTKEKFLIAFDEGFRNKGYSLIAGIDEAGRGPLAGPVVAAACVVPQSFFLSGVDDSKKLTPKKRRQLYQELILSVNYGVGIVSPEEIDQINIFQATIVAMQHAVAALDPQPDFLLVDGLRLPHHLPEEKVIKGDQRSFSIAAASIIAKETRDRIMVELDKEYPLYGFATHKGYGTLKHRAALSSHGASPIHRRSFSWRPV